MSETTTTLTPEAALAKLEQDAVDGKPVTVVQLANARAAIDLAALVGRGEEKRAAIQAEKDAAKARADAKAAVSGMLDGAPGELLQAFDDAVAGLKGLFAAHEAYQAAIQDAGQTLSDAKVPTRGWSHEPKPDHYDPKFSAHWAHGGVVSGVTVDGVTHSSGPLEDWIRQAVYPVLWAHYETQSLAAKLGSSQKPKLLAERNA